MKPLRKPRAGARPVVLALACSLALGVAGRIAHAEDIDIYVANASRGDRPNVLIVLDNSANWSSNLVHNCKYVDGGVTGTEGPAETSSKVGAEKCALNNVFDALPVGSDGQALFNVGLMMFSPSGSSVDGGYPRLAILPVDDASRPASKAIIRAIQHPDDKSDKPAFAKAMHEAYLYYAGAEPYAGNQVKRSSLVDSRAFAGGRYASPSSASCARNYVIFIGNGGPDDPIGGNKPQDMLAGLGGDTTQIEYASGYVSVSDQANYADEYARFMASADVSGKDGAQVVTTYTIGVTDGAKTDEKYLNFLRGMAHHGGGEFYEARSVADLTDALLGIFEQLAEVDSAFVSASLPVSVNSRGTYQNQIFMGLFRPDGEAAPRWRGNLKQYQFLYDSVNDSLQLADRNGTPAISPDSGFFAPRAESFWSADSTFWINEPMGTPPSASDLPDGEVVEKGGHAQRLRSRFATSLADRVVYTCLSCVPGVVLGSTSSTRFDRANPLLDSTALAVPGAVERDALIDWVRGIDNAGDETGPGGDVVVRPSIHGDVLHSRPVVVNYGSSTGAVVFYGANDGMLHAIDGNQTGANAGREYWTFVPQEGFAKLNRLRANAPAIRFSTTPDALADRRPRDYFVDGPLSFYQKIESDGSVSRVYLFFGMRRGGRTLYALDVTDPASPRLLWRHTAADPGFSALGQTWSEARVARVKGTPDPVLVVGAGYDPAAEDVDPQGSVTMGNAVLVLDATTGALLASFPTARPVPADVALVDSDFDGIIDRGYAADLGGNVYRIDFETATSHAIADWRMTHFASLGSTGARKFFFAPDVVLTRDYAVVLVGSGDREKPLNGATTDRFFTLVDTATGKELPEGFAPIEAGDLVARDAFTSPSTARGCYIALDPAGEKVVNAPVTAGGVTYFSTNRPTPPSANSCTGSLGEAKVYGVPLFCKAPRTSVLMGGGLPPSPVTGTVAITLGTSADGTPLVRKVPFIIGGFNVKDSGIEVSKVPIAVTPRRKRLYWYPETER